MTLSDAEVEDFASRWPGSGLKGHSVTFEFDDTGNLVNVRGEQCGASGAAMLALCAKAQQRLANHLRTLGLNGAAERFQAHID